MIKELTLVEKFKELDTRDYCKECSYTNLCDDCKMRKYANDIYDALAMVDDVKNIMKTLDEVDTKSTVKNLDEKEIVHEPHYLESEENQYFTYVKSLECKGHIFDLYNDDYGMSYCLAYEDNGEIETWGCGTCNDYSIEMNDIADHLNKKHGGK